MLKPPIREPIRVSDHAVLRYLERGMGFNLEAVREHIAGICSGPAAFGAVCVRTEGLRFEIVGSAVTTVRPDSQSPGQTSKDRSQCRIARKSA